MSFSLEHFDLHFPPELLPAGEQLFDSDAVTHYEEIEKNLWAFEVNELENYEVEILISPSKVNNYSCECQYFKNHKGCKHVVASLFILRLLKTKKVSRERKTIKSNPSKLNISNIINQVPVADLKNFVRNYSKTSKHFSTALKANFARSIDLENNEEKYESILNGIIKPSTSINYRISHQSIKQFINVANQFDAQFEDSISLKQYKEAFFIIKSLLAKVAYINHWTLSQKQEIKSINVHFHKQFEFLIGLDIPPSLKQDVIKFGLDLAGRSYYHVTDSELNLLNILFDPLIAESKEKTLVSLLNERLNAENLHDFELEYLWVIRQYYVEKKAKLPIIKAPLLSSQSVFRICEKLTENKAYHGLKLFLELFKFKGQIRDVFLLKSYIKVLQELKDYATLSELCIESLIIHKDIFFYEVLKSISPNDRDKYFKEISSKIIGKKSLDSELLYLKILASDLKTDELIDYLSNSRNAIVHIYSFIAYLSQNSDRLGKVVLEISDRYLNEYLGRESSIEMRKLLIYLRQNEFDSEMKLLKKHLITEYTSRKSLKDEIKDV